jgi:hypothetical protein
MDSMRNSARLSYSNEKKDFINDSASKKGNMGRIPLKTAMIKFREKAFQAAQSNVISPKLHDTLRPFSNP